MKSKTIKRPYFIRIAEFTTNLVNGFFKHEISKVFYRRYKNLENANKQYEKLSKQQDVFSIHKNF